MKAIDLVGQKFGRLKVLRRESNAGKSFARFAVVCECGTELIVEGRSLRSGNTKSCGCYGREVRAKARSVDLTGGVFGRVKVLGFNSSSKQGNRWRCLCDCGAEFVAAGKTIAYGSTRSCGCANREYLQRLNSPEYVGKKYGHFTVLQTLGSDGRGVYWLCKCDCGIEKRMRASTVQTLRVVSCGCAVKRKHGLIRKDIREKSAARCAARRAAKLSAGGSYTAAQIDELRQKQRNRCANCGCKLTDAILRRDHRQALANGGSNDILNMELLCQPCNLSKGAKDEIAWARENGRLI